MPRTAAYDRLCNLTLDRDEWSVFLVLLQRTSSPVAATARTKIQGVLAATKGEIVSIPRECEKWATLLNLVWEDAMRLDGPSRDVCHEVTVQLSTAQYRG